MAVTISSLAMFPRLYPRIIRRNSSVRISSVTGSPHDSRLVQHIIPATLMFRGRITEPHRYIGLSLFSPD